MATAWSTITDGVLAALQAQTWTDDTPRFEQGRETRDNGPVNFPTVRYAIHRMTNDSRPTRGSNVTPFRWDRAEVHLLLFCRDLQHSELERKAQTLADEVTRAVETYYQANGGDGAAYFQEWTGEETGWNFDDAPGLIRVGRVIFSITHRSLRQEFGG